MTARSIKDRRGKEVSVLSIPDQGFSTLHIRDRSGNSSVAYLGPDDLRALSDIIQEAIAAHSR